jgi:hypothetical protein
MADPPRFASLDARDPAVVSMQSLAGIGAEMCVLVALEEQESHDELGCF